MQALFRPAVRANDRARDSSGTVLRSRVALLGALVLFGEFASESSRAAADSGLDLPTIFVIDRAPRQPSRQLENIKLPLAARESPLNVETIERPLIESSGYNDLAALLDMASSALTMAGEGGSFSDVTVRGFGNTPLFRNGLNDALIGSAPRSVFNIERVEILKGPDAALFGPGEAGGAVNYVTKQPAAETALTTAGEFGYFDATTFSVDATGPVPRQPALRYRLVAAREQGDTFRDFVKDDRWFVAPALAWQPSAALDIVTSFELTRDRRLQDTGIIAARDLPRLPRTRFLGEPEVGSAEVLALTTQTTATLALARAWELELQLQGQRTSLVGETVQPAGLDDDGALARELTASDDSGHVWVVQLEAAGPALLWGQRHDLVGGLEATALEEDIGLLASDSDEEPFALDPLAPRYGQALPVLFPKRQSHERRRQLSAYAQDLWQLDRRWRILAALRLDHVRQDGFEQQSTQRFASTLTRPSPRLSVVRTSSFGLTWYASYSQSLEPNEGLQPDGQALSPTLGKAVESGLRYTAPDGRYTLDGALFGIRQTAVAVEAPGAPGFEIQTASQDSVGADVELELKPAAGLSLALQYHYLDTSINDDPIIPDGTAALNAPRHQAGMLALYQISWRSPEDLAIGLALRYVGQRQASLEPSELALRLDDYVRVDLFARWRHTRHLAAQLRLENVTGANYIQGSDGDALHLQPGAPFALYGELRVSF